MPLCNQAFAPSSRRNHLCASSWSVSGNAAQTAEMTPGKHSLGFYYRRQARALVRRVGKRLLRQARLERDDSSEHRLCGHGADDRLRRRRFWVRRPGDHDCR